ncbi:MAG TPA: transcription-repair coupling factor, partial [Gemmataceae bacterium]|nr:transcription-repair coupling factor [Gemmataceae bacterium]
EGWPALVQALRARRSGTVDGAWGSSAALAAATLGLQAPATVLVVLAHPGDLESWANELAGFSNHEPVLFPIDEPDARHFDLTAGQRLRIIQQLQGKTPPRLLLASVGALIQPVPEKAELSRRSRRLQVGANLGLEELSTWLVDHGYRRVEAVEYPAEFSRRGGIFDIFSADAEYPYRLELFGDEIESIRQFSTQTQRSLETMQEITVVGLHLARSGERATTDKSEIRNPKSEIDQGHLCDYLRPESCVVLVEPEELHEQGKLFRDRSADVVGLFDIRAVMEHLLRFPSVTISAMPHASVEASCHLRIESVERFSGNVAQVREELDAVAVSERVLIACQNDAECHRLSEVLAAGQLAQSQRLKLVTGRVRSGFRLVDAGVVVLGSQELFHRETLPTGEAHPAAGPQRRVESRAIDSFLELSEGDLVVHVSHGIARYHGMHMLDASGASRQSADGSWPLAKSELGLPTADGRLRTADFELTPGEEHLLLEFRDGVFVYVPASKIDLVQKYVGSSQAEPELSKFGGTGWKNRKERVEAAVMDLAAEMLQLQAVRAAQPSYSFPADSDWQKEFEASFPYQETPDQFTSLAEIKADMERNRPMDRLLCGDVGYGKTELAVRAAFKAIDNGKQVAVLVPTTVLAEQHFRTFSQRFAEYPFVVECLSRFRSGKEQKQIIERLAEGAVDVVIGTHRLVSKDVKFKDLGLVIIDEEQRFGVEHKEKLKQMRATVHILTLSATPIPRTLHMALLGIRDISNLETPPPDRLPIETRITRFDRQLIRHAILRELNRDGQVYFVHNRVQNIGAVAGALHDIVPEAQIVIGHGQMSPDALEAAMLKFIRKEADILVATTIIESGLDNPNTNTIFINQADIYGLADLHQLRGRVGRHKNRAYAYLLLESDKMVTPTAARRLKAIEEFTQLGAGFKIAMRDLEIRGAGNLLGTQQSGHIAAVGYELYCQLLENAVRRLRNQPVKTHMEVTIDLPLPAFLPRDYVPGQKLRIEVYRRLARLRSPRKLEDFRQELRDRFGSPPVETEWLLKLAELRMLAARWQIASIHRKDQDLILEYRNERQAQRLADRSGGQLKVVDESHLYYRIGPAEESPEALFHILRTLLRLPSETL